MVYWGHGSSAVVIGVFVLMLVLRATAGRRRPAGGGQRGGSGFLAPPTVRHPSRGPSADPGSHGDPEAAGPSAEPASRRPGFTGIPAGWLPDPTGRHERRYWSGRAWTEHVTSGGVPGSDPPPGAQGWGTGSSG